MNSKNKISFSLIFCLAIACMEIDISIPGLPKIAKYFNASETLIQSTITLNFLGFCLSSFLIGPLADSFGRKKMMNIGTTNFVISSFMCMFTENIYLLLISRFLQGISVGIFAVLVFVIISEYFSEDEAPSVISKANFLITFLTAIAPILGSFLLNMFSWRANYTLIFLGSIISWITIWSYIEDKFSSVKKFDLIYYLKHYLILSKNKDFMILSLCPSLLFSINISFLMVAPFIYCNIFSMSELEYGLHQGIIVGFFTLTSFVFPHITKIFSNRILVIIGSYTCSLSGVMSFLCYFFSYFQNPYYITFTMSIFYIGFAIYYPPIFSASTSIIKHNIRGTATSYLMSKRAVIVSIIGSLTSLIYTFDNFGFFLLQTLIIFLAFFLTRSIRISH